MLSVTSVELNAWMAAFLFPFARIMALMATSPVLSNNAIPNRVKIGLGALLSAVISPTLGPMPAVGVGSATGLWIIAQQIVTGAALGLTMRLVFSAVEAAGDFAGMSMGLSFANFFQSNSDGATQVVARFLNFIAVLAFLSADVHLQMIAVLADTFAALPVTADPLAATGARAVAAWGGVVFSAGLSLALPVIVALLITNLALAILNRAAPQIGIFQVGFPLTLAVGMLVLELLTPNMWPFLERLFGQGLDVMMRVTLGMRG
jgi:flagellar biosynthetic protein FliR